MGIGARQKEKQRGEEGVKGKRNGPRELGRDK